MNCAQRVQLFLLIKLGLQDLFPMPFHRSVDELPLSALFLISIDPYLVDSEQTSYIKMTNVQKYLHGYVYDMLDIEVTQSFTTHQQYRL